MGRPPGLFGKWQACLACGSALFTVLGVCDGAPGRNEPRSWDEAPVVPGQMGRDGAACANCLGSLGGRGRGQTPPPRSTQHLSVGVESHPGLSLSAPGRGTQLPSRDRGQENGAQGKVESIACSHRELGWDQKVGVRCLRVWMVPAAPALDLSGQLSTHRVYGCVQAKIPGSLPTQQDQIQKT